MSDEQDLSEEAFSQEENFEDSNNEFGLQTQVMEGESTSLPIEELPPSSETTNAPTLVPTNESYKLLNNAHIFVDSGIHEGATFKIITPITIGSSIDNDLILTDENIEETHVALEPYETKLGYGIRVTCRGNNVVINGEQILTTGQSYGFQESFIITLANVSLQVIINKAGSVKTFYKKYVSPQVEKAQETNKKLQETLAPKKLFADVRNIVLLVFGLIILVSTIYIIKINIKEEKIRISSANIKYHELSLKREYDSVQKIKLALGDLKMVLKQYNLDKRIDAYYDNTSVYVSGTINFYENGEWAKVQSWYDSTYASEVTLVSLLEVNNGARRTISFRAVVSEGKMPFVVSWTGDRYRIGATLPGGWIILGINDKGVVVRDAIDNRVFLVEHIRMPTGGRIEG